VKARAQQDGIADKASLVLTNVLGLLWDTTLNSLQLANKAYSSLDEVHQTKKVVLQE